MLFKIQICVLFGLNFTTSYYSQMTSCIMQMSTTIVFIFFHTTYPIESGGWSKWYRMSSIISLIVQCPISVSHSDWPKATENKNALQECIKIFISQKRLLVQPWWSQTWRGTGQVATGQIYAYTRGIPRHPLWNKKSKRLYLKEEETKF